VFQIPSRKSELDSIDIFTILDPNASEGLLVRLQAARNGSAVDPGDRESDVARQQLPISEMNDGDFTNFDLPDHNLAPADDPFLIVEGAGSVGHRVAVDGNKNLTHRAFFPFFLLGRASNGPSVDEFRRRDLRRKDDQLQSEQAVQDAAQAALRHRSEPERRISAAAATPRTHQLRPGQAVRVLNFPVPDVSGSYIVTERQTSFDGVRLDTDLTFVDATTL
jgi:hypothetical protein